MTEGLRGYETRKLNLDAREGENVNGKSRQQPGMYGISWSFYER